LILGSINDDALEKIESSLYRYSNSAKMERDRNVGEDRISKRIGILMYLLEEKDRGPMGIRFFRFSIHVESLGRFLASEQHQKTISWHFNDTFQS
jgi:hypothetical protein